jgi:hypothetical protein
MNAPSKEAAKLVLSRYHIQTLLAHYRSFPVMFIILTEQAITDVKEKKFKNELERKIAMYAPELYTISGLVNRSQYENGSCQVSCVQRFLLQ